MSSGLGNMDIRLPMGIMFSIIGALIAVYGMTTTGDPMYDQHSLGININLWWGLVMLALGIVMILLVLSARKRPATP